MLLLYGYTQPLPGDFQHGDGLYQMFVDGVYLHPKEEFQYFSRVMVEATQRSGIWTLLPEAVSKGNLKLQLCDLFDWSESDFREFSLFRARILECATHPQYVGCSVLVPVRQCVVTIAEDSIDEIGLTEDSASSNKGAENQREPV